MTDKQLTLVNPASEEPPRLPSLQSGGQVRAIVPTDFDGAWRIANAVVKSGMAPKGVESPEQAMVTILHGMEVGMTPMMALQSIATINGRPSIYGDGALGLVQGSGLMEWHKEWYENAEGTDAFTAVCQVKRKNDPEIKTGRFSIADAKKAGVWSKAGPWTNYPKRMLQMRARSFTLRDGFADVMRGLHVAEEAMDIAPNNAAPRAINGPPAPEAVTDGGPPAPDAIIDGEVVTTQPAQDAGAAVFDGPPAPDDDDGIPDMLRRFTPEEEEWLDGLKNTFDNCESLEEFRDKQNALMAPKKSNVSHAAWAKAQGMAEDTYRRVMDR